MLSILLSVHFCCRSLAEALQQQLHVLWETIVDCGALQVIATLLACNFGSSRLLSVTGLHKAVLLLPHAAEKLDFSQDRKRREWHMQTYEMQHVHTTCMHRCALETATTFCALHIQHSRISST